MASADADRGQDEAGDDDQGPEIVEENEGKGCDDNQDNQVKMESNVGFEVSGAFNVLTM